MIYAHVIRDTREGSILAMYANEIDARARLAQVQAAYGASAHVVTLTTFPVL